MTEHGRLIVVAGERVGRTWPVESQLLLGRSAECDITIDDDDVSRRHAIVRRDASKGFTVEDLGSSNGTLLNGERVTKATLRFGDKFRVGYRQVFALLPYDPVEEELFRRHRLETLGRLTAGVAHDLNNMLGAVSASSNFLRDLPPDQRGSSEAAACLDDIDAAALRGTQLATRLLTFARTGGASETTSLTEIVLEAVKLARRTFSGEITITTDVAPQLHVEGNPAQLHQVVMNLLVNARDAVARTGGHIDVGTYREEGHRDTGVVTVSDDGQGMDEDTLEQVFEPFYTTKGEGRRFGLGLATVADIVASHGGDVEARSLVGKGSTFVVTLPLVTPKRRTESATMHPNACPVAVAERHVLLVDDEAVVRRSMARILKREGAKVSAAGDAEEALDIVRRQALDVAVLDLDLPGMRGDELLVELHKIQPIPTICVSGHRGAERIDQLRARGAVFLGKPFRGQELLDAIQNALGSQTAGSS